MTVIQQLKSKNGKVVINIASCAEDVYEHSIIPAGDFSFVEIPEHNFVAHRFYTRLHYSQTNNHISLNTCRVVKQKRLSVFNNIIEAENIGFKFQDFVSIVSDKEAKHYPNTLHGFAETAVLLSKTDEINIPATEWFNLEQKQATNHWMVEAYPQEKPKISTGRMFTFEVGELLASLSSPLINRKFLIFGIVSFNYLMYAKLRNYDVYAITDDLATAKKSLSAYDSTKNK